MRAEGKIMKWPGQSGTTRPGSYKHSSPFSKSPIAMTTQNPLSLLSRWPNVATLRLTTTERNGYAIGWTFPGRDSASRLRSRNSWGSKRWISSELNQLCVMPLTNWKLTWSATHSNIRPKILRMLLTSSECNWIINQQLTDTRKSAGPDQGQTSSLKFKKYSVKW